MTDAAQVTAQPVTLELLAASAMKYLMGDPIFKVGEADIRGNTYRVFENIEPNLGTFFEQRSLESADREFLFYEGESWTFGALWRDVARCANALQSEYGVKKGDHVAIAMRNYPEWCISYMALARLGAVVVPLNAWWQGDELKFGLEDSEAKLVIVDGRRLELIAPFKEELGLTLILARDAGEGADARFEDVLAKATSDEAPVVDVAPDDRFCIVYTSGSTGKPKGVILTHRGAMSAIYSWFFILTILDDAAGGNISGPNPGILLAVPLFHVTGSHSIFMISFLLKRRMVIMRKWDAEMAADIINKAELTHFVGVPSQSFELMNAAGNDGLPTLCDVGAGGAKRPAEHVERLIDSFERATPSSGYGLSETNALGCAVSRNLYRENPDSTGRAVPPLTDIKIMKDGVEVPRGEVGEIWIRTPGIFEGYWKREEATAEVITDDGWFKSGDLGKMDEREYVTIVDRMKEIIIRGGENISCLEVESAAYEHEAVREAVVFSVPCDVLGERVGLVFYPKDDAVLEAADLQKFIGARLAKFKTPERIWVSPAALPRLGTEKFDKIMIKRIAMQNPPHFSA